MSNYFIRGELSEKEFTEHSAQIEQIRKKIIKMDLKSEETAEITETTKNLKFLFPIFHDLTEEEIDEFE